MSDGEHDAVSSRRSGAGTPSARVSSCAPRASRNDDPAGEAQVRIGKPGEHGPRRSELQTLPRAGARCVGALASDTASASPRPTTPAAPIPAATSPGDSAVPAVTIDVRAVLFRHVRHRQNQRGLQQRIAWATVASATTMPGAAARAAASSSVRSASSTTTTAASNTSRAAACQFAVYPTSSRRPGSASARRGAPDSESRRAAPRLPAAPVPRPSPSIAEQPMHETEGFRRRAPRRE